MLVEGSLSDFVRSSRDVLTVLLRGELHQMIVFGFEVDTTPRPKESTDASDTKVV